MCDPKRSAQDRGMWRKRRESGDSMEVSSRRSLEAALQDVGPGSLPPTQRSDGDGSQQCGALFHDPILLDNFQDVALRRGRTGTVDGARDIASGVDADLPDVDWTWAMFSQERGPGEGLASILARPDAPDEPPFGCEELQAQRRLDGGQIGVPGPVALLDQLPAPDQSGGWHACEAEQSRQGRYGRTMRHRIRFTSGDH